MIKGFDPIVDSDCHILILGLMPSISSLEIAQYYGHPQNRFWKLMNRLLQGSIENYESKKNLLLDNHIALWDVVATCEREGSLDSAIVDEVPNDIVGLLVAYPKIELILCNGRKSYDLFRKYYPNLMHMAHYVPSTSPANAMCSIERLVKEWGQYIKKS